MIPRLILVGGFLGAGKTTWLLHAVQLLAGQGYRVGLVTNDQGENLVDTALVQEATIPVTEVAGGCFCCRFPDLMRGLQRLQEVANPEIVLAEPVGSCTDLVATVLRPLAQFHSHAFHLAPLSVLVDATRSITAFPDTVRYLYHQQMAEAELLLLNKMDLLDTGQVEQHLAGLQQAFPRAHPMAVSARTGAGLAGWLAIVLGQESRDPQSLVIDYERYAAAEATLGWLNTGGLVWADTLFSPRVWLETLLRYLARGLAEQGAPVAHVKAVVQTPNGRLKASLTQSDAPITWDVVADEMATQALDFVLNVRVNAPPALLEQTVLQAVETARPQPGARYYFEHFECFSPLPPKPTHRL